MKIQKWTTQSLKKFIAQGEKELLLYQKGSKQWMIIYSQIEWLREELSK